VAGYHFHLFVPPLRRISEIVHRSDPELIQSCQRGDQAAWNALIDRYGRLVYSIPRRYGLSDADSDDVFSAVWEAVFKRLDKLRDQTRLSAWLITTTHRETWRVGKKNREAYLDLDDRIADVSSPSEDQIELWEQQDMVRRGLKELGGRCQELLSALFMEQSEPSYEAVAQRLGMTVGSIGPTRARCFKKLEAILIEMGFDSESISLPQDAELGQ
jgi:RNA polymerase sigma factor (sigma-70 family)